MAKTGCGMPFMAMAFIELFDATKDARWKDEAIAIVDVMDKHFADPKAGGWVYACPNG